MLSIDLSNMPSLLCICHTDVHQTRHDSLTQLQRHSIQVLESKIVPTMLKCLIVMWLLEHQYESSKQTTECKRGQIILKTAGALAKNGML